MSQPALLPLAGELKPPYRPRVPQQSVYYRLVEEHFEQLERVSVSVPGKYYPCI